MSGQSLVVNTQAISGATATWFPAETAVTGTVSSADDRVTGTGTAFKTELNEGDFLVTVTNDAIRILRIESDTDLILERAVAAGNLSGATVRRVRDKKLKYLKVFFITNNGNMRGAGQAANVVWPFANPWETPFDDNFFQPQLVTPGAGGASVIYAE